MRIPIYLVTITTSCRADVGSIDGILAFDGLGPGAVLSQHHEEPTQARRLGRIRHSGYPARAMTDTPGFDPYEARGVGIDADEIVIQLAYRARIRAAHPDVAGAAGLAMAKRLNVARDWLLDPDLRARLTWVRTNAPGSQPRTATSGPRSWGTSGRPRSYGARHDPVDLDPDPSAFGPHDDELRAFLRTIETLSPDERARVNYSLGEARPADLGHYRDYLGPRLWVRSRALRTAVERAWRRGLDEASPYVPRLGRVLPTGFLVANAYAQWILLEGFLRDELEWVVARGGPVVESLAARCVGPWEGSVGQPRYGPRQQDVLSFFGVARALPVGAAERLARSWRRHMGRDGRGHPSEHIGPGAWLPAPPDYPDVLKVSGYVAAVDASRIDPPEGLDEEHHAGFCFGLRLTAHVLSLGLVSDPSRDYLRPWRDAVELEPSLWSQLRLSMPTG